MFLKIIAIAFTIFYLLGWISLTINERLYYPLRQIPGVFIPPAFVAWYIYLVWQGLSWWKVLIISLAILGALGSVYASLSKRWFLQSVGQLISDILFIGLHILFIRWIAGL